MTEKELLRNRIEEERTRLNHLLSGGGKVEEIYCQSVAVDRLIEQYMDCSGPDTCPA